MAQLAALLVAAVVLVLAVRGHYSTAVLTALGSATVYLLVSFLFGSDAETDVTAPIPTAELARMAERVRQSVSNVTTERIVNDLRRTRSVEKTIANLSRAGVSSSVPTSTDDPNGSEFLAKKTRMFDEYRMNYLQKFPERLAKYNGQAPDLDNALKAMRDRARPR